MTGTTRSDGLQFNAVFATRARGAPAPTSPPVERTHERIRPARIAFALSLIGLGLLGLIHGDFALVWQRIPIEHLPGRTFIAYLCAIVELVTGVGLLLPRFALPAAAGAMVFTLLWAVLLKLPAVLVVPTMEATWLGLGEILVIYAGAWTLYAQLARGLPPHFLTGERGVRSARIVLALALPMIGLSHFFYTAQTITFIPGWLPFHTALAWITGAGSIAASAGIAFGVWPALAARLEAVMLALITALVWLPAIAQSPGDRNAWTALVISCAITFGAWAVADAYRDVPAWRVRAVASD
ncbi:hypothetical protein [Pinirhizobacter sp.]|jgi:uncharacterized membrane protein|uniref:hypothetical protein n=1 Tax=Pinirhizobacter sp. TaxID=2950432 RepID=UPI002F42FA4B